MNPFERKKTNTLFEKNYHEEEKEEDSDSDSNHEEYNEGYEEEQEQENNEDEEEDEEENNDEEDDKRKNRKTKRKRIHYLKSKMKPLSKDDIKNKIALKLIDLYFKENPYNLVQHHLDSFNDFFEKGIRNIFKENNPIRIYETNANEDEQSNLSPTSNECLLYLGGKEGNRIYYGKPMIYHPSSSSSSSSSIESLNETKQFMYPNLARLHNLTYSVSIHYDVEIEYISKTRILNDNNNDTKDKNNKQKTKQSMIQTTTIETLVLPHILLGRFPIMLHSHSCLLYGLDRMVRYNMGECRNDYGGYFIVDGKEKFIIPQEKFADNMLYIREIKQQSNIYSHSAEIRSISEDSSKPTRTVSISIVRPSTTYTNNQIVVHVPNLRKPIPLFILMRALGLTSDKEIIEYCLLDLKTNESYLDLFIPSIHDTGMIYNQQTALEYMKGFHRKKNIEFVMDILTNYFLPHIGEKNYLDKAYFVGYMVYKLLRVFTKDELPTDRDNFRFKRVELPGTLLYNVFREYYLLQQKYIALQIDKAEWMRVRDPSASSTTSSSSTTTTMKFTQLINLENYHTFFEKRVVEEGIKKAFKGNWGAQKQTKKVGVVQDINRLSYHSFISQLRKLNLPLDSRAKVVGPRALNSSQFGYIDPVDSPDGKNIGLHKHLSLTAMITNGYSGNLLIQWLRFHFPIRLLQECLPSMLSHLTKLFVNGRWIGVIDTPLEMIKELKQYRRHGILPLFTSIGFDYQTKEIHLFTDSGRLTKPLFYIEKGQISYVSNYQNTEEKQKTINYLLHHNTITWNECITGKKEIPSNQLIYLSEEERNDKIKEPTLCLFDYIDTSEEEGLLIANSMEQLRTNKWYTHIEWYDALLFGVMGNQVIFPENNPIARNVFSCGQSKQAISMYHTNYLTRMDKMGVILQYGQIPLIKSRFTKYVNYEEHPYGVNTMVAIMSHTGYNVEDAILINEGSLKRGLFRTTYYTTYVGKEDNEIGEEGENVTTLFGNIAKKQVKTSNDLDYRFLDENGIIREETPVNDECILIGKMTSIPNSTSSRIPELKDASIYPKKGQLGYVDKTYITPDKEGHRIAKVRIREERIPAIGDKMASRSGQKGTIGLIIPEEDMPFTSNGLRPDLIINPHAIPSRMTIGQLLEMIIGKIGAHYGSFGNCTAFESKGPNTDTYNHILKNAGYHSSGNEILYNGLTGEQITSEIFLGPTYYMRLKHMVKDKINYRGRGPNVQLTRQPVQGRANDGGLRIGEMERDGIMAHGATAFLNDSFMNRAGQDEYYMAVCNKTGCIAIYNPTLDAFLSPFADGPLQFTTSSSTITNDIEQQQQQLNNKKEKEKENDLPRLEYISRFGRSFSIVRVPYSFKLLIQELQVMNIQMRIITDDNIDQLQHMSFSNNIQQLMKTEIKKHTKENVKTLFETITHNAILTNTKDIKEKEKYQKEIQQQMNETQEKEKEREQQRYQEQEQEQEQQQQYQDEMEMENEDSPSFHIDSPMYQPNSPMYQPNSPAYASNPNSPAYAPNSPAYAPNPNSPAYAPSSYEPNNNSYPYDSYENDYYGEGGQGGFRNGFGRGGGGGQEEEIQSFYNNIQNMESKNEFNQLTKEEQITLINMVKAKKKSSQLSTPSPLSILLTEEEQKQKQTNNDLSHSSSSSFSSSSSSSSSPSSSSSSSDTKKIIV